MTALLPFFVLLVPFLAGVFAGGARRKLVYGLVVGYAVTAWLLHLVFEVPGVAAAMAALDVDRLAADGLLLMIRLPVFAVPIALAFALGRLLGTLLRRIQCDR